MMRTAIWNTLRVLVWQIGRTAFLARPSFVNGEVTFKEDTNQVPQFFGVILKDGKKISFLGDAGGTGYNEAMPEAYTLSSFVQVIEPDQVQSILLQTDDGTEIELPLS